jgi:hypothetical protein
MIVRIARVKVGNRQAPLLTKTPPPAVGFLRLRTTVIIAGLIERGRLLQEEITSRLEEQNTRTLFTLTLVMVLAMPINIVVGFFGMNVGGIPLAENKHGFWVMVLLVAGFTGLTAGGRFAAEGSVRTRGGSRPPA